ncbi:TlpA family protein disulfide reductase [Catalinimonas niigatensis]|uniref:TlpA family protein disulfide reductase n=1 Tax=Catalinimonas niigatensis TaxID=1397264 RepID=UPI0026671F5B|nr:TlpA disulfide reductase family protein [Catalinimonas niigatensis]WPP50818.1 TlpA disulfide reductase family protein [Catalinimonas niigatensis]
MKRYANPLLLCCISIIVIHCSAPQDPEQVRLQFEAPQHVSSEVKLGITNSFDFSDSVLGLVQLDTQGVGEITLHLTEPMLAYMNVQDQGTVLYLTPGDDLNILVDTTAENKVSFAGSGALANNYLLRTGAIRDKMAWSSEQPIWQLEPNAFITRLDSMRDAFEDFHTRYSDSVKLPENLDMLLKHKNRLELITLKENYILVHYAELTENPVLWEKLNTERTKDTNYEVPMDTAFLREALLKYDYSFALDMYLDIQVVWPLYQQMDSPAEEAKDQLPLLSDQEIRDKEYPAAIKEFLIAKNTHEWMMGQGITPVTDSLFAEFKKEYPQSEYLDPINKQYEHWLSLSSGKPAPDITGITPEGKNIALSELKGKVVYVDVWATWCRPCIEEFPNSKSLHKQYEKNDQVTFLYVSIDRNQEAWEKMVGAGKVPEGTHMLEQAKEEDGLWQAYMLSGIPRYLLIDQEGKIANANAPRPSSGKIKEEIDKLMQTKVTAAL